MTVARTDVGRAREAPSFDPRDDNYSIETRSFTYEGEPIWRVISELRRAEWLEPGELSVRVRWDDEPTDDIAYVIEVDGATVAAPELLGWPIRYLYFDPAIILDILERRTGRLTWYSRDTGSVGFAGQAVHFGVNERGLINVLGKDVAELPADHQRIYTARNVTPEGNVSDELLAAQQSVDPRDTTAPEVALEQALTQLDERSTQVFGRSLYRKHQESASLLRRVHRPSNPGRPPPSGQSL